MGVTTMSTTPTTVDSATCRFGELCVYADGPHHREGDHAWRDEAPGIVNGQDGTVYVYSLVDGREPNEILVGLQLVDDPDHPMEARLSMEQAAYLLQVLTKAVHYGIEPEVPQ